MKYFKWYSNWKNESFVCPKCGWEGRGVCAFPNMSGVMECPECDHGVGAVEFPNLRETEEAAAQGNEEAISDLPELRERLKTIEARMKKFEFEKLEGIHQLPELDGGFLEFALDVLHLDGEDYNVVQWGDTEIWRELAFWDNVPRFDQIKDILKQKYRTRFTSLTPTNEGLEWLTGDHYYKFKQLNYK